MPGAEFTVLDNSNIVESYPGITLPLTYSYIKRTYDDVFRGLVSSCLKNDEILKKFDPVFENMIKSHNGRIYYQINNWYSLIDFMPFSKKFLPLWQEMMGVQNRDVYLGSFHKFTVWQKTKLFLNGAGSVLRVKKNMERLREDFALLQESFQKKYSETLTIQELLALFYEVQSILFEKWHITLINDMYAIAWTGVLKRRLQKKGAEVTSCISGITSLESLKPVRLLLELSKKYGRDEALLSNPEIARYLEQYGDRCPCELKLEMMTYREQPALLEQQIRTYASDPEKLEAMIENLRAGEALKLRRSYSAKRARLGISRRETARLDRGRIYGMVRRIFIRIGEMLANDGFLETGRDIFYLTIEEIEGGDYGSLWGLAASRKNEYAAYEKLPGHERLVFRGETLIDEKIAKSWTGSFTGIGTSMGDITAEAVVLESPGEGIDVKGKIIVTKTTDPGWVFLLTMAGGIVAEKGSLLSHTAIVSRELSIPAVVAVDNATAVIKTGDILHIDGEAGRVTIVESA
ncbi:MAG: PEP-utilizing enzyme [Oscillospiraceae bacterium]|nr:PEP-utilizing enzyme [Oscillospiraceae bacterium]